MQGEQRVEIIDVLRGWALFVVVVSNYLYFGYSPDGEINCKGTISSVIEIIETHLFSAKGWTLLFVLFGFGFGVIYAKKKQKTYGFIIRRMLVLMVFALFNSLLFDGDILRDYAVLGLLFLFFIHLSVRMLLGIVVALLVFLPYLTAKINAIDASHITTLANEIAPLRYSQNWLEIFKYNFLNSYYYEVLSLPYSVTAHYVMFICMLFGLALQKANVFSNLPEKKVFFKKAMIGSLVVTLVLWAILIIGHRMVWPFLHYFSFHYWIVLSTMVFTASVFVMLHDHKNEKFVFKAFSYVGKMTFTNYLLQNIIALIMFQGVGLGLFHHLPFYFYFLFAVVIYCVQIVFSYWWLQTYTYGPFEWVWRKLSATGKKSTITLSEPIFVEKDDRR